MQIKFITLGPKKKPGGFKLQLRITKTHLTSWCLETVLTRNVLTSGICMVLVRKGLFDPCRIGIGIGNALFHIDKIIEKKNHMHKMHNTSSSSYQSNITYFRKCNIK